MQKPLPPAESLRRMIVPAGFRVELFAAEPDFGGKPICMTWDERGRLCQQLRYFKIAPKRGEAVYSVELIKGEDRTAPVVMAVTAEAL